MRKCGHPCIGLCGEPCPRLCRVCDKSKVEELFFGDEDEKDARFVGSFFFTVRVILSKVAWLSGNARR